MNLNATLFVQYVVFFILCFVTMKFVWPPIMNALDERVKKIADGLAAADRGRAEMQAAENRVQAHGCDLEDARRRNGEGSFDSALHQRRRAPVHFPERHAGVLRWGR